MSKEVETFLISDTWLAQPDGDLSSVLVDLSHEPNLGSLFVFIMPIDAERIGL